MHEETTIIHPRHYDLIAPNNKLTHILLTYFIELASLLLVPPLLLLLDVMSPPLSHTTCVISSMPFSDVAFRMLWIAVCKMIQWYTTNWSKHSLQAVSLNQDSPNELRFNKRPLVIPWEIIIMLQVLCRTSFSLQSNCNILNPLSFPCLMHIHSFNVL